MIFFTLNISFIYFDENLLSAEHVNGSIDLNEFLLQINLLILQGLCPHRNRHLHKDLGHFPLVLLEVFKSCDSFSLR